MFAKIAAFELRYQIRSPLFWAMLILFFLLAFGAIASENIQLGGGGSSIHKNAPLNITLTLGIMSIFFMLVTTAFVANVIVRDDESGFGSMVRSTSVSKFDYLIGRFCGAFAVAAIAFIAVPLGMFVGTLMPWVDPETIGPNYFSYYAWPYLVIALPNLLFSSALFFAVATTTRSMLASYIAVIAFFILWAVSDSILSSNPDLRDIAALLEPFGASAMRLTTIYWTSAEANSLLIPFTDALRNNRLIWGGVSLLTLAFAYRQFSFVERSVSKRALARQERKATKLAAVAPMVATQLPAPDQPAAQWPRFFARVGFEMRLIFKSPAFVVLLLLGLINSISIMLLSNVTYGVPAYPATYRVIEILRNSFTIMPTIVAAFYAGELVWRDRDRKMHELIDASALPDWAQLLPKLIALSAVLISMLTIVVVAAALIQLGKGFTAINPLGYLAWYLVPGAVDMVLIAGLAIVFHVVAPNKYVGWGLMVVFILASLAMNQMGFQHPLYQYGNTGSNPLTDMNDASVGEAAGWWLRLYWGGFCAMLMIASHLIWRRGTESRLRPRLQLARLRLNGVAGVMMGAALLLTLSAGGWLYYQMNILSPYISSKEQEKLTAEFEKRYLRYETAQEPAVKAITMAVDLYPEERRAISRGRYQLVNDSSAPISEMHMVMPEQARDILAMTVSGAKLAVNDDEHYFRIYRFDTPLAPGATATLDFTIRRWQRGARASGDDMRLLANGTFLNNNELGPIIGVSRSNMLSDPSIRRKYGLPSQLRMAKLGDEASRMRNYLNNADWVSSDITLSTSADQTPIAPGNRVSDSVANGRRTARFVTTAPILNFWSVQSARYAVRTRQSDGVTLSVYYHPAHGYNVDRMLTAFDRALTYYRANFGPYQFDYARIIEFPDYSRFAQAFAGTMPYSEGFGFLADFRDPKTVDYATYVAAHELGHQYWGHQLISADQQGGTMLVETMAQYSAMMVMKQLYGEDKMRQFLKYELDSYLRSRRREAVEELPLNRVENQGYIHYRKGAVALYLLQDRLGEDRVNAMLRDLLNRYRFKSAPFATSTDLVQGFHSIARTPAEHQLISDTLERITIYDLKVDEATTRKLADGRYETRLKISAVKFDVDGTGKDRAVPLAENIDIGLFTERPGEPAFSRANVLLRQRMLIRNGTRTITLITRTRPTFAGLDPYNMFIDRNSADNVKGVK